MRFRIFGSSFKKVDQATVALFKLSERDTFFFLESALFSSLDLGIFLHAFAARRFSRIAKAFPSNDSQLTTAGRASSRDIADLARRSAKYHELASVELSSIVLKRRITYRRLSATKTTMTAAGSLPSSP